MKSKVSIEDYKETLWEKISFELRYTFPFKQLYDLKYYLKNLFFRRHHLINTRLPKGRWYDTDTRMLYGMMNLLIEYIDKEKPFETIDWDSDPEHKHAKNEMFEIRDWWLNYHNREEETDEALSKWHDAKFDGCSDDSDKKDSWLDRLNSEDTPEIKELFEHHSKLEENLFREEEEMLSRLIKIRRFLWT